MPLVLRQGRTASLFTRTACLLDVWLTTLKHVLRIACLVLIAAGRRLCTGSREIETASFVSVFAITIVVVPIGINTPVLPRKFLEVVYDKRANPLKGGI